MATVMATFCRVGACATSHLRDPQHEARSGKDGPAARSIPRVSTDQGLEQDFNSLDAQYDASQAYVRSQAHGGWTLLRGKYDDGGFSGGNTDRPALQRLLGDVRAGKIDIIVVYKVDRLTQQFNTTTSMGRLTLNVLLSFAQFEREVTSERIRDKISASKRKGLWVGGMAPLGYDTKGRKITVNEVEAKRVRTIFCSYLKFGSLNLLMVDLRKRGIVTKIRTLKTGETCRWHSVYARLAGASASQSLLCRRSRFQRRSCQRRAVSHSRSGSV